jgi:predicted nucleotidyltransferase
MKYGLNHTTVKKIHIVFASFPEVEKAILYGSRAKGNFKPGSDIDLTLKGNRLTLSVINQIGLQLDELLLPYTFDISVFDHIKDPELLDHINRIGIEFYNKIEKKLLNN